MEFTIWSLITMKEKPIKKQIPSILNWLIIVLNEDQETDVL